MYSDYLDYINQVAGPFTFTLYSHVQWNEDKTEKNSTLEVEDLKHAQTHSTLGLQMIDLQINVCFMLHISTRQQMDSNCLSEIL